MKFSTTFALFLCCIFTSVAANAQDGSGTISVSSSAPPLDLRPNDSFSFEVDANNQATVTNHENNLSLTFHNGNYRQTPGGTRYWIIGMDSSAHGFQNFYLEIGPGADGAGGFVKIFRDDTQGSSSAGGLTNGD